MRAMYGQLEQAFRDTLVQFAERRALDSLGEIYGFSRPGNEVSERAYGPGLHQAAYARRGTRVSMAHIIEAMLSDYNAPYLEGFIHHSDYPDEILEVANPAVHVLTEDAWTGRWIRTASGRHWVYGVELNATRAPFVDPVQVLKLSPYAHSYTDPFTRATEETAETVPLVLLPFVLRETNPGSILDSDGLVSGWTPGLTCTVEILLFSDTLASAPPTYLLPDGSSSAVGMGVPFGGHLLEDNTYNGNQDIGPFPVYLIDGRAFTQVEYQLNRLMAAGTWCDVRREPLR